MIRAEFVYVLFAKGKFCNLPRNKNTPRNSREPNKEKLHFASSGVKTVLIYKISKFKHFLNMHQSQIINYKLSVTSVASSGAKFVHDI